jgi:hypothetical protein
MMWFSREAILIAVFLIPPIHFLVSTNRMAREAAAGQPTGPQGFPLD